ncbi:MAG: tyrosinase family protein [Planctomycetota bacterium]|nr:tyrosinase family protein [Planctomycetota bacterium]
MAIRKDANTLTAAERTELVAAVLALKTAGVYDQFVTRHANAIYRSIHRCSAFLPWHRRFIWDLESELQRVSGNPNLGLPYWNWPQGGAGASMWDDDLLGGDGGAIDEIVTSGPFRQGQWTIVNSSGGPAGPLTRALGRAIATLPTQAEIDQVLGVTPYDGPNWNEFSDPSFRNELEGWNGPNLHNRGHVWVGGSMRPMTSPNDPVFFMHHCMVDKLWNDWQLAFPNQGYLPMVGGPFGQNLNDPMDSTPVGPIGNRPIDMLDSAALNIQYDSAGPVPPIPVPTLVIDGGTVNGSIASAGEVDEYTFDVAAFGSLTIETSGNSDTVMTLSGPNDPTNQLAFNDDGGANLNSRIVRNLSSGEYVVRVGLFNANATGNYAVGVSTTAGPGPAITELIVGAPALNAAIGAASESDMYRFQAQGQGDYVIETSGPTDTFLTLFGPNSQTIQIAENDDGGFSLNSRISRQLDVGEYFVRVRHFSVNGTGPYQVSVRQV